MQLAPIHTPGNQPLSDLIVNNYNGFIYTVSREYKIGFMNQTLADHIGRDATGSSCFEIIHGRSSQCPWCVGEKVLSGESANFEYKSPRDNRWYYYVSTPMRNGNGDIAAQQLIAIDIDHRKRREETLHHENRILKSGCISRYGLQEIVGQSPKMREIYALILDVALSDAGVLILGESGTGKELVANAIHNLGPRKASPFVPVNCGGIPDTLVESEFFGFKKGAFTNAHIDKSGFLEIADKGTLFMDEIGEINSHMQVKLLRALDGDGYTPLGGNQLKKPDVRIICATHQDLKDLVDQGRMRADFYYRINVVPIHLPPLRERKKDIPLLIYHFLNRFCPDTPLPHIPASIMSALENYHWPGNVRELQNIIHRYVALKRLDVFDSFVGHTHTPDTDHLPWELETGSLSRSVQAFEKQLILHRLEKNGWNQSRVADLLGVNRKTLYSKIKKYRIARATAPNNQGRMDQV